MLVDHTDPDNSFLIALSFEPELTIVTIECDFELGLFSFILCDSTAIKVEVERSLALLFTTDLLEVLKDSIFEFNVAILPAPEDCWTVLS